MCVCLDEAPKRSWEVARNTEHQQWKTVRMSGGGVDILPESSLQCIPVKVNLFCPVLYTLSDFPLTQARMGLMDLSFFHP